MANRKQKQRPDVFEYTDYRVFLQDLFNFKKTENRNFTYRYFSMKTGYSSPSTLKEVIDGKRGIPARKIRTFIAPFGLNRKEVEFFEKLVQYNQATEEEEKSRHFREIIKLQRRPKAREISPDEYSFYSDWFNSALRELVTLKDFKNDSRWIAKKLSPQLTPEQAKKALDHLLKLGFIKKDKNGKLVQDVPKLTIDPDTYIMAVKGFMRRMIEIEWESIERFEPQDREISGLSMNMSKECYEDVKIMVRRFKEQVLDYVCNHPGESDVVCRLNFGLFPLISDKERQQGNKGS